MTDNEIIKALECCCGDNGCFGCPYTENHGCRLLRNPIKDALDLLNRQKAEIERLGIELKAMRGAARSYKALIDGLKENGIIADDTEGAKAIKINGISADVKEMVGDGR